MTALVEGSVTDSRMQEITGEHSKDITSVLQNLVCDGRWLTSKDLTALLSRDAKNLQGRILGGMVKWGRWSCAYSRGASALFQSQSTRRAHSGMGCTSSCVQSPLQLATAVCVPGDTSAES